MKKIAIWILTGALVLSLGSTAALAAGRGCGWRQTDRGDCPWCGAGCTYVDANGDGSCDNRPNGDCNYGDADGDGVCDSWAAGRRGGGHHGWGRGCHS